MGQKSKGSFRGTGMQKIIVSTGRGRPLNEPFSSSFMIPLKSEGP